MQEATNLDRFRAILVIFATVVTIVFNSLAAIGYVNGVRANEVSERYPSIATPAGYAFSIWSLIYLGIIAFGFYQILPSQLERLRKVRTPYIASCLVNCAWIYFWHREQIVLSFGLILLLLLILAVIHFRVRDCRTLTETWLVQAPFGIYTGWVTVATIANLAIMLVYLNVKLSPSAESIFVVTSILFAALAAVFVRIRLQNFFYPLAVAWGITAIAVKQGGNTPIVVAAAVAVVICLVTAGSFVVNLMDSTSE